MLDGRIFGGHAKRVPAHRLQDVLTKHAVIPRDHVGNREHSHMAHVQFPARIREHCQAVKFLFVRVFVDLETAGFIPVPLGFLLNNFRLVRGGHRCRFSRVCENPQRTGTGRASQQLCGPTG